MTTHSSILAWKIPSTEEPGGVAESDTTLTSMQTPDQLKVTLPYLTTNPSEDGPQGEHALFE